MPSGYGNESAEMTASTTILIEIVEHYRLVDEVCRNVDRPDIYFSAVLQAWRQNSKLNARHLENKMLGEAANRL